MSRVLRSLAAPALIATMAVLLSAPSTTNASPATCAVNWLLAELEEITAPTFSPSSDDPMSCVDQARQEVEEAVQTAGENPTSCSVEDWTGQSISCATEVYNPFADVGSPVDVQALSSGEIGATFRDSDGAINPQVYLPDESMLAPTAEGNPYGCYGQTDNPHRSSGDASVHAYTECSVSLPYMFVNVELYRDRWYGEQFLDAHYSTSQYSPSWSRWRVEANARWNCAGVGTYTYRAYSYHEVRDSRGKYYYGRTYWPGRFAC